MITEEVRVDAGGATLAGSFTSATEPVSAALLIPGSGRSKQVPPSDVDAVGQLVRGPFEGHVVGDLSHLLRPDPGLAGPRGYKRSVRQPVSPQVLALVTDWVTRHWGTAAAAGHQAAALTGSEHK